MHKKKEERDVSLKATAGRCRASGGDWMEGFGKLKVLSVCCLIHATQTFSSMA